MRSHGFSITRKDGPSKWLSTDIIILGTTNHKTRTKKQLDFLTRNIGLFQDWNVMLYSVDDNTQFMTVLEPILFTSNVAFDGICMLHAHMRLRNNLNFLIGWFVHMADKIEGNITDIVSLSPRINELSKPREKICEFIKTIRDSGAKKADIDLFRCASHIIFDTRNISAHLLTGSDSKLKENAKILQGRCEEFFALANNYDRDDLLYGVRRDESNVLLGGIIFWYIRITMLVDRWVNDFCCK